MKVDISATVLHNWIPEHNVQRGGRVRNPVTLPAKGEFHVNTDRQIGMYTHLNAKIELI
jgi:hypothetical protein